MPSYDHINLYSEEIDLPQLKPKAQDKGCGFFFEVPKSKEVLTPEEAHYLQGNYVYEMWHEQKGYELMRILEEKKRELSDERRQIKELKK